MSEKDSHVVPLYAKDGSMYGILLSPQIWDVVSRKVAPILEQALDTMYPALANEKPEPLDDWQQFKDYWDFKYPFNAEVECKICGSKSADWEHDPAKPFHLKSASLSGLCVFHCKKCRATVRKKHFKDHICFEATVAEAGNTVGTCGTLVD
ncbi:MAG: hypothetical protein ACK5JO_09545 [Halodesulfovibrio sp.]